MRSSSNTEALLTRAVTGPSASAASPTRARTRASSLRSACNKQVRRPKDAISSARFRASSPDAWWWIATSNPASASLRQMARPILRAPPVTRATPRTETAVGSVNPTELIEVDGRDDGDEAEDDAESQHGMLLLCPLDKAARPAVQAREAASC